MSRLRYNLFYRKQTHIQHCSRHRIHRKLFPFDYHMGCQRPSNLHIFQGKNVELNQSNHGLLSRQYKKGHLMKHHTSSLNNLMDKAGTMR